MTFLFMQAKVKTSFLQRNVIYSLIQFESMEIRDLMRNPWFKFPSLLNFLIHLLDWIPVRFPKWLDSPLVLSHVPFMPAADVGQACTYNGVPGTCQYK